ncbi:MAG: KOW motif-containing protein [Chthoniobacterales bacterium]|nr:KOW motif-containing protein [Chthoniobacterales bacterium]
MESVSIIESTDPLWFCLRTRPKHEKLAAQFLRTHVGLEVFSPLVRFQRATMQGKKWFEEALFPCYIFGRFPYLTHFRLVASAMGVTKVVGFGGQPSVVADAVITELREFARDNETIEIAPAIEPGDEVTVLDGPFKGLRAVVTRVMPAKERVAVLLELLGTQREVEVTAQRVVPGKIHPLSGRALG